jgi:hypothetical protein
MSGMMIKLETFVLGLRNIPGVTKAISEISEGNVLYPSPGHLLVYSLWDYKRLVHRQGCIAYLRSTFAEGFWWWWFNRERVRNIYVCWEVSVHR